MVVSWTIFEIKTPQPYQERYSTESMTGSHINPAAKTSLAKPNRPCDRCRKRKSKCVFDDGQEKCYLCTFHNHECEFNMPAVKKRKLNESPVPGEKTQEEGSKSRPKPVNVYHLGGNNEFDDYLFNDLLSGNKIQLNQVNTIRRTVVSQGHNDLFLEVEQNNQVSQHNLKEMGKIDEIIGDCGPRLVALYFRIVHTSFPILSTKFLDDYKTDINKISPCVLSCLYLFALNWWSFDSDLSGEVQPSQMELEKIAEENLYQKFKRPTLSTIQAGLLLIQHQSFRAGYENPSDCWPMQCAVVGAAQTLGLNRRCDDWDIPLWEKSLRKRLTWGIYIQEKWLCLSIDQRSHISPENWIIPDLNDDDDFQDFLSSNTEDSSIEGKVDVTLGKELFVQKVELSKIIDLVLSRLYSIRAKDYIRTLSEMDALSYLKEVVDYIKPLQIKLTAWEAQLPKSLIIELNITRGFISGSPNIYVSNFMAQAAILRPVLRALSGIREKQLPVGKEFMGIRDIVFTKCMTIFENILKFLNQLKAEHLQTFWYTSSRLGFTFIVVFGYFLALISKNEEEFDKCTDKLEEYVWKLKINNKNAEFFLHSILWWGQLKKLLSGKLKNMKFYNQCSDNTTLEVENSTEFSPTSSLSLNQKSQEGSEVDKSNINDFLLLELFNLDSLDNFMLNYQQ